VYVSNFKIYEKMMVIISTNEAFPQPQATKRKDKKKKLLKIGEYGSNNGVSTASAAASNMQSCHSSSGSGGLCSGSCSASSGEGSGTSTNGVPAGSIVPKGTLENKSMQMAALSQSMKAKTKLKIKEQPGGMYLRTPFYNPLFSNQIAPNAKSLNYKLYENAK
jgi:hypothetical protein